MLDKKYLIIISLLLSNTAHAIPPPDALISIWQSALQLLGVISVFLVGFYYALRQYLSAWKKPILGFLAIAIIGSGTYLFLNTQATAPKSTVNTRISNPDIPTLKDANPSVKNTLIQGEQLSIKDIIAHDPSKDNRKWKLQTYQEMQREMSSLREKNKLSKITMHTMPSFNAQDLNRHITESPEKIFLLDVRAAYERKRFSINHQATIHYGDLVNSILPKKLAKQLPKDKTIIVLCHSGLRGYISSHLLQTLGYKNVAFLQGGLHAWNQQELPINGQEDYSYDTSTYPIFGEEEVYNRKGLLKVDIDADDNILQDIPDLIHLPFEIASSQEIDKIIQQSKITPLLIICKSYSGCFHIPNFGYLVDQAGGKVAGVFDLTGEFIIPPIVESLD
ncbi:MAG: rhodanese-like domain-containing protein [Thiotrichaceae bacterium]|nr:rhodanese-like domain-containing protein [Thiotrichaceae bacterium]